jgi:hypothetical protein
MGAKRVDSPSGAPPVMHSDRSSQQSSDRRHAAELDRDMNPGCQGRKGQAATSAHKTPPLAPRMIAGYKRSSRRVSKTARPAKSIGISKQLSQTVRPRR